ncbi:MAG: acetylglutamate kinase [Planctomycetota bacterium]
MITVVKVSGKPISDPHNAAELWSDLATHADDTVVVHGGGPQVDALLARLGGSSDRRRGIRLTSEQDMPIVASVLAGHVNQTLVGLLRSAGVRAVGLSLASAGVLSAEVDTEFGGRVGRISEVDGTTLRLLLKGGLTPVVAPIACESSGGLLNVNADDAAAGIARAIRADRVVLLTDVAGVHNAAGNIIDEIDTAVFEKAVQSGVIKDGMIAKIRSALSLAREVEGGVVIASWRDASRVLRGEDGVGTRVVADAAGGLR